MLYYTALHLTRPNWSTLQKAVINCTAQPCTVENWTAVQCTSLQSKNLNVVLKFILNIIILLFNQVITYFNQLYNAVFAVVLKFLSVMQFYFLQPKNFFFFNLSSSNFKHFFKLWQLCKCVQEMYRKCCLINLKFC